jgi:hypothetical protein
MANPPEIAAGGNGAASPFTLLLPDFSALNLARIQPWGKADGKEPRNMGLENFKGVPDVIKRVIL